MEGETGEHRQVTKDTSPPCRYFEALLIFAWSFQYRLVDEFTAIGKGFFKKETDIAFFLGMTVVASTGDLQNPPPPPPPPLCCVFL